MLRQHLVTFVLLICAFSKPSLTNPTRDAHDEEVAPHVAEELVSIRTYTGKACSLPFTYKNHTYYGCTSLDHPRNKVWCPTEAGSDPLESWELCVDSRNLEIKAYGGTSFGESCNFPFTYKEATYNGCTSNWQVDGQFWCGVSTEDTDTNIKKLAAKNKKYPIQTKCVFPFIYNGNEYFSCTGLKPWCSTSADYDADSEWKWCCQNDVLETFGTIGRTVSQCTFPFVRNGKLSDECWDLNGESVCSETNNYDRDQLHLTCTRE